MQESLTTRLEHAKRRVDLVTALIEWALEAAGRGENHAVMTFIGALTWILAAVLKDLAPEGSRATAEPFNWNGEMCLDEERSAHIELRGLLRGEPGVEPPSLVQGGAVKMIKRLQREVEEELAEGARQRRRIQELVALSKNQEAREARVRAVIGAGITESTEAAAGRLLQAFEVEQARRTRLSQNVDDMRLERDQAKTDLSFVRKEMAAVEARLNMLREASAPIVERWEESAKAYEAGTIVPVRMAGALADAYAATAAGAP